MVALMRVVVDGAELRGSEGGEQSGYRRVRWTAACCVLRRISVKVGVAGGEEDWARDKVGSGARMQVAGFEMRAGYNRWVWIESTRWQCRAN